MVKDHYATAEDFRLMITTAQAKTNGEREDQFLDQLLAKFERFGMTMFLSQAQSQWLCDIAAR